MPIKFSFIFNEAEHEKPGGAAGVEGLSTRNFLCWRYLFVYWDTTKGKEERETGLLHYLPRVAILIRCFPFINYHRQQWSHCLKICDCIPKTSQGHQVGESWCIARVISTM